MRDRILDDTGRRVPRRLFPQFREGRRTMQHWLGRLSKLRQDISNSVDTPYGEDIDHEEIREAIERAYDLVLEAMPARRCLCFDSNCQRCEGREWLSAKQCREDLSLSQK